MKASLFSDEEVENRINIAASQEEGRVLIQRELILQALCEDDEWNWLHVPRKWESQWIYGLPEMIKEEVRQLFFEKELIMFRDLGDLCFHVQLCLSELLPRDL